ncbi:DNA repair protein RecO [Peptostreptococcus faecalis]|uniref:DNA repair protein RecO n=1 Tax=Peptostreptococcus faecalis TaxID=2045015 RepID=UPI000C7C9670|nr:DNA repair protein RecO [Peptostreptococcus faecalis]
MIVLNTQGIVLKNLKYKENDLILTVFTKKYGKTSVMARGAQRQKSRFLSTSQIFSYNNYILKKQNDFFTLSQSESIKSFYNISKDFESFSYASFITKLIENNIVEGQPNNRLFHLLTQTLFLFSEEIEDRKLVLVSFILKFIDYMGYRPEVNRCVSCGTGEYRYALFSTELGGIVCDKCIDKEKKYVKINQTTISLMQYILKNDIIVCSKAKVSKILVEELFYLLKEYLIRYFGNVNFRSLEILKGLN